MPQALLGGGGRIKLKIKPNANLLAGPTTPARMEQKTLKHGFEVGVLNDAQGCEILRSRE